MNKPTPKSGDSIISDINITVILSVYYYYKYKNKKRFSFISLKMIEFTLQYMFYMYIS
jgi:hypothetical protein